MINSSLTAVLLYFLLPNAIMLYPMIKGTSIIHPQILILPKLFQHFSIFIFFLSFEFYFISFHFFSSLHFEAVLENKERVENKSKFNFSVLLLCIVTQYKLKAWRKLPTTYLNVNLLVVAMMESTRKWKKIFFFWDYYKSTSM